MRNVLDKIVEKIKTHILVQQFFFFSKIVPFMRMRKKCGRAGQTTDDNVVHVLACWIPKATNKHIQNIQ